MRRPSPLSSRGLAVLLTVGLLAGPPAAAQTPQAPGPPRREKLAPFVPTPQEVVDRMLAMAEVKEGDVVYDLGCGDGRLVITAAKRFGVRGLGVDIDPERIAESKANAKRAGVDRLVEFRQQDARDVDLSGATVVTLYLLTEANLELRPRLQTQLKPGSRVVSHQFGMGDWVPQKAETFVDHNGYSRQLYLWVIGAPPKP